MSDIRIKDLPETLDVESDDYVAVDNAGYGTRKYTLRQLIASVGVPEFVVNVSASGEADKTLSEITSAIASGYVPVAVHNDEYYQLTKTTETSATFTKYNELGEMVSITVSGESVLVEETPLSTDNITNYSGVAGDTVSYALDELSNNIGYLSDRVNDTYNDVVGMRDDVSSISSSVQNLSNDISDVTSDIDGLSTNVETNTSSIQTLDDRVKNIEEGGIDYDIIGEEAVTPTLYEKKTVVEVSDTSQLIKGKFVDNIPVEDESGTEYFTDYLDISAGDLYSIGGNGNSGNSLWRVYDENKVYLGARYLGFSAQDFMPSTKNAKISNLRTIATSINESAKYLVIPYYSNLLHGTVIKNAAVTENKLTVQGREFSNYGTERSTKILSITNNGDFAPPLPVIGGETYQGNNNGKSYTIHYLDACQYYISSISIEKNEGTEFEITVPNNASYIWMGGSNVFTYSFTGNFPVEKMTAPELNLVPDNFNADVYSAIADGLGISIGRDVNEVYYNCTKYGVLPGNEDNTDAFQALIDLVNSSGGGTIWIPNGTYVFKSDVSSFNMTSNITCLLEMKSDVNLLGESIDGTVLKVTGNTSYGSSLFAQNSSYSGSVLVGCKAENFTVDMSEASLNTYTHRGKAFYYSGIKDCIFRDLKLLSTPSTSLGIDMLDNVVIDSVYVYQGGRQWSTNGNGGAGIGIGTGKWKQENYIIRNCICDSCGHFGIFLEDQGIFSGAKEQNFSKGQIIANNIVRNGRNYGIGLRGGRYVNIVGNNVYSNSNGGIYLDYGADSSFITSNLISDEPNAICFGNEDTTYACTKIAISNNTFAACTNGVVQTLTPTDCVIENNITI